MGNNVFTITISAVDKATATVRKVNDSVDRLTRPFSQVGKSFKSLGRELGFDKIGKNLGNIGREAAGAARGITSIVAPMAAITGVGSVAGIAALATNWAKLGRSIDNSARGIGISSGQLQSFQGAAKLVGIDSESTTGSLESLATTMQDARWGRNQGALMLLNKLGIGLKRTKDGANDVVGEYKAIADAIAKEANPQVQALIANNLGLGNMLPFLREGSAGIERYEQMVKRLGYTMGNDAVERSKEFAQSLAGLELAADGTKNAIGDALIPVMKPMVDEFATWLSTNRELIATDVAGWVKSFAGWLQSIDWKSVGDGMTRFLQDIKDTVDWLGGWKNAAILVAVAMNAQLIASVVGLGVSMVRGGAGILTFIGQLVSLRTAASEAAAAQSALGAAGTMAKGAGALGLVAGSGYAGYQVGTMIYDNLISGTSFGDKLGEYLNRGAAALGVQSAQDSVDQMDRYNNQQKLSGLESQYRLPPGVLDAIWNKESSRGKNMGTSSAGAKGHFQLMDATARQYGVTNPADFDQASQAAARIMRDNLDANGGNLDRALAAYNWGQGNLDRKGLGAAPAETRDYIRSVEAQMGYRNPGAPQGPISSGAAQAQESKVHVEVELKNAPEGTKAQVKTQGNAQASSRIAYSGVGAIG